MLGGKTHKICTVAYESDQENGYLGYSEDNVIVNASFPQSAWPSIVSAGANCGSNLSQNEVYEFGTYCSSINYQYTENLIDFGSTE